MNRSSKQTTTVLPSTVKIYDNFTFPRKPLRAFSPMPNISAQTIDIHKMYKRVSQKTVNPNKNPLFCTTELKAKDFQRTDSMPQPKHAIFDTVQIEISKLNKALADFPKKSVQSPFMNRYSTILSEIKPQKVGRYFQATDADTQDIERKSASIFSNAYIENQLQSPQRLASAHSIRVKSTSGVRTIKQALGRRVQSSHKQKSQVFANQPLLNESGGYQPEAVVAKILAENSSAQMEISDYLDVKPPISTNSQLRASITDKHKMVAESYADTPIELKSSVPVSNTVFDQTEVQSNIKSNKRIKTGKRARFLAQAFSNDSKRTNKTSQIRATEIAEKSLRKSSNIDKMVEYVTNAHKSNFEKKNNVSHLLKINSPRAEPVNIVINNSKMKQQRRLPNKVGVKCQDQFHEHHTPAKKTKLGLQDNELIIVSKPQDEPPFFNILIEQRHANQLSRKNLDDESRLEVIYRVLKDQLRRAKKDLLQMKLEKVNQQKSAAELKKQIENAKERSGKKKSIADEVISPQKGVFQLSETAQVDPSLRRIVNHLISTDVRKHNRYCPCCKNYDEGADLSLNQMGEFLEYIRQLHNKLAGDPKKDRKKGRPREYVLDYDSVSDITDLSEQGILTTSMEQLSPTEKKRLELYMRKMRQLQQSNPPKHNCLDVKKTLDNSKLVVEMQLRGVQLQLDKADEINSAHQFTQRSMQIQADDDEREQINMQTTLIDLKSKNAVIDIYDISRAEHHPASPKIGFKRTANKSIGTGESAKVKLVAPQDWYFSELNRRLMREFYQKNGIEFSQEILNSFKSFDEQHSNLQLTPLVITQTTVEKLRQSVKDSRISVDAGSNPQESSLSSSTKILCEPEVTYLTSILKQSTEKWQQYEVLKELHQKTSFTAKTLTKELIEGKTPIGLIINNHLKIDSDSVVTLLYRCEKLFQARADVQKILMLLLKIENSPNAATRTPQEHQQLVQRLKGMVGQFKTEYRMYDKMFIYKGRDVDQLAENEQDLEVEAATSRSLSEKADDKKIQGILKSEARYEGAIGPPKDQKTEIQIVDQIADELQSKNGSMSKNMMARSTLNSQFLEKVKDEIHFVRNSMTMQGKVNSEENDSLFKLRVDNYAKNGVKIKRVALLENVPYEDLKQKQKRKSKHRHPSPHQSFI